jgi:hypothetical protein
LDIVPPPNVTPRAAHLMWVRDRLRQPHVIIRPSLAGIQSYDTPGGVRIYRDDSVPGGLRTDHDDPPAYDDPSKFGGG